MPVNSPYSEKWWSSERARWEFPIEHATSEEDFLHIATVMDTERWVYPSARYMKLNLAAGHKLINGWYTLDLIDPGVDNYIPWNAEDIGGRAILPFVENSVGAIFIGNAMDHFSPEANVALLREAERVLVPGAPFIAITPHYASDLAHQCLDHYSKFGTKTFNNIIGRRPYDNFRDEDWRLRVGYQRIVGFEERNMFLVTQLIKTETDKG